MSISVWADWDMPRRDRAQIELRRIPVLRHANGGLALDRFADLTRRGNVAFKGSLKRPPCDGIAIGCTWPELQLFSDILGQLLFGNVGVAVRDRLHARPARRVAALPGFPRDEAFRVRIAVSHYVFLSLLPPIAQASYFLHEIHVAAQRKTLLQCEAGRPIVTSTRSTHFSPNSPSQPKPPRLQTLRRGRIARICAAVRKSMLLSIAVQPKSALGFRVTLKCRIFRRS